MRRLLRRLREPSTWAGLAVLGGVFGVRELSVFGVPEVATLAATGAAALAAIFLPERPGSDGD
jgi:hypothetical protein